MQIPSFHHRPSFAPPVIIRHFMHNNNNTYGLKLRRLQDTILQLYEPWLCNTWSKVQFEPNRVYDINGNYSVAPGILNQYEEQIADIMKEVFTEEIPYLYMKSFQVIRIREYLKTRPGKVLEIAKLYHHRYYG